MSKNVLFYNHADWREMSRLFSNLPESYGEWFAQFFVVCKLFPSISVIMIDYDVINTYINSSAIDSKGEIDGDIVSEFILKKMPRKKYGDINMSIACGIPVMLRMFSKESNLVRDDLPSAEIGGAIRIRGVKATVGNALVDAESYLLGSSISLERYGVMPKQRPMLIPFVNKKTSSAFMFVPVLLEGKANALAPIIMNRYITATMKEDKMITKEVYEILLKKFGVQRNQLIVGSLMTANDLLFLCDDLKERDFY